MSLFNLFLTSLSPLYSFCTPQTAFHLTLTPYFPCITGQTLSLEFWSKGDNRIERNRVRQDETELVARKDNQNQSDLS